jgi:hypothetical protein
MRSDKIIFQQDNTELQKDNNSTLDGLRQREKSTPSEEGWIEGIKEQAKEEAKSEEIVKEKLHSLVKKDEIVLFKAKTFFPFDFFPDTIIIDPVKVSILSKQFIATEQLTIINIKDITDAWSERVLFLANLVITYVPRTESQTMQTMVTHRIKLLNYKDAMQAQSILKCMLIIRREDVDITKMTATELESVIKHFEETNHLMPDSVKTK